MKWNLIQNSPAVKGVRPKDEKTCEIQSGGQVMALMVD